MMFHALDSHQRFKQNNLSESHGGNILYELLNTYSNEERKNKIKLNLLIAHDVMMMMMMMMMIIIIIIIIVIII